ncbi:hypothetical protein ACHAW5_001196 [Stephanodiscus triporus]|uniref:Uncharacterized protein n=1 Tax=Stephanodiscus triporus TaxID=2934178 RepID=A0ABD3NGU4_9STRA
MTKRKVNDLAIAELEREVRSMKVKTMKSELEALGVSLLGLVEKNDLIDALLRARRDVGSHAAPSSSSAAAQTIMAPMPASLREFARQFEDANVPDLARDAMTLIKAAWDGRNEHGIPIAHAIKRGSKEFDELTSDYIKTVPAETTAMVGDAFDAAKFTRDANVAFKALKSLDFAKLGTIHYEHIYSALNREGDDWYGRSGYFVFDSLGAEVRVVAKFCSDIVELTESLRKRTGHRIAIDMAEVTKLNDSRTAEFSFEEKEKDESVPLTSARSVIVRTSGKTNLERGTRLIIHHSTTLSYLPNDAISLAYIKVENLIPGSTSRTIDGKIAPLDRIEKATCTVKWDGLFGTSVDPLLTPRMAARIHELAGITLDHELRDYYTDDILPTLPEEALLFFKRSAEWRDDYYQCYTRIGMRLQNGLLPRPECYGENVALSNIMDSLVESGDGDPVSCEDLPAFPNDDNYSIVEQDILRNDKIAMLYRHPNLWFHTFEDPSQPKITSYFAPKTGKE